MPEDGSNGQSDDSQDVCGGRCIVPICKDSRTVGYHGLYADYNDSRSASHKSCLDIDRPGNWNLSVPGDASFRMDPDRHDVLYGLTPTLLNGTLGTGRISVASNASGTCTFTNEQDAEKPTLTLIKRVSAAARPRQQTSP